MNSTIEKLQRDLAFYEEVSPIMIELEAAREVRKTDSARWEAAQSAAVPLLQYWGGIRDYLEASDGIPPTEGLTSITAETLSSSSSTISPAGGN
jgi:hypothetical protein